MLMNKLITLQTDNESKRLFFSMLPGLLDNQIVDEGKFLFTEVFQATDDRM